MTTSLPPTFQLAIETTGTLGSIALLQQDKLVDRRTLDPSVRTARTLVPSINELVDGRPIGFISVAEGPGSFTGLRIGVTTAKTLCYAWQIPLVAVDSLAAIAAETIRLAVDGAGQQRSSVASPLAQKEFDRVLVGVNAYRGQVFCGEFPLESLTQPSNDGRWGSFTRVVSREQFDQTAVAANTCLFAGDEKLFAPLKVSSGTLQGSDPCDNLFLDRCDAVGVGMLGRLAAIQDQFVDPLSLVPRYLKLSAAEEKASSS